MSKDSIPTRIDPFRFAENSFTLEGSLPISDMARLCESLISPEGGVDVNMTFGTDEQGIKFVKGHFNTEVKLQCQRCLEAFNYAIIGDFMLGIVHTDEEADQLPERYDALIVKENSLIISDMIEDELIVSLPIVSMHELADCQVQLPFASGETEVIEKERENPFQVIEKLRSKRKD